MKRTDLTEAYGLIHLPAKVALAVVEKPSGGYNLITLEWFMRTSIQPPMFAISIGHTRYTHECYWKRDSSIWCFPELEMKPVCAMAGSTTGREIDKMERGDVQFVWGKLHKLPVPKEAVTVFECEVVTQVRSGDHTIFVGEVRYSWANPVKKLLIYK